MNEPLTARIQNDNMYLYVQHNARDHEVFVTDYENSMEGISLFTASACREVAAALTRAADWLETLIEGDE